MDEAAVSAAAAAALRRAGARFAFVHGSRASGTARPDSDLDVAAWWGTDRPPAPYEVGGLPGEVDLLVLDQVPLELAGRVALRGRLLFDDDPLSRVRWQADTRKVYLDEQPRQKEAAKTFFRERVRRWGRDPRLGTSTGGEVRAGDERG